MGDNLKSPSITVIYCNTEHKLWRFSIKGADSKAKRNAEALRLHVKIQYGT